jgi:UDP-glucose 4-epimerase
MKVLVTGGAGYVGTELVRRLSSDQTVSEIIVYDNLARETYGLFFTTLNNPQKIRFVLGDILDTRKLKKILPGVDVVYHLAARVSTPFAREDSHVFEQVNHWGTAELSYLLEASDVRRVIYTSSASVYGFSDEPVVENTVPRPATHYGVSKLNGENVLARLKKQNVLILRCGNVYGHGSCLRFDAVINKMMFDAHYYNRVSITGSGNQFRSFIHVDLMADALANLLHHEIRSGTYNLTNINLVINDISRVLKKIYPGLEALYIEQDLQLRSLLVEPSTVFQQLFYQQPAELEQQLRSFQLKFGFSGGSETGATPK